MSKPEKQLLVNGEIRPKVDAASQEDALKDIVASMRHGGLRGDGSNHRGSTRNPQW